MRPTIQAVMMPLVPSDRVIDAMSAVSFNHALSDRPSRSKLREMYHAARIALEESTVSSTITGIAGTNFVDKPPSVPSLDASMHRIADAFAVIAGAVVDPKWNDLIRVLLDNALMAAAAQPRQPVKP